MRLNRFAGHLVNGVHGVQRAGSAQVLRRKGIETAAARSIGVRTRRCEDMRALPTSAALPHILKSAILERIDVEDR